MPLALPSDRMSAPGLSAAGAVRKTVWLETIAAWRSRLRHREGLALLACKDIHILQDVGLTPELLQAELKKPFWKA